MPSVRVTCLLCEHPVEVPAARVVLHLDTGPGAANRYGFPCPDCTVFVVRRASDAVVDALLTADVAISAGGPPPWEAADRHGIVLVDTGTAEAQQVPAAATAAPLTEADVLLFRKALDDDAIMAAWLAD